VHEEQWHHHLQKENYIPIHELSRSDFTKQVASATFIKIAQKLDLSQWDTAIARLTESFIRIGQWFD
jgi:hypothetical protein